MIDLELVEALFPLSRASEYAAEFGAAIAAAEPGIAHLRPALPLAQAADYAFLTALETYAPELAVVLEAAALAVLPARVRRELEAERAGRSRSFEDAEAGAPPPPPRTRIALVAPQACIRHGRGYGDTWAWTQTALLGQSRCVPSLPAGEAALARVHAPAYLQGLAALGEQGRHLLTPETVVSPLSQIAWRAAAGAMLAAAEVARAGEPLVLAYARPGSHHASTGRAGGTCLVNNLAVAAAAARASGIERAAIVDLDAHHGNGTEAIFAADETVLTVSVHQAQPFYPGSGDEQGGLANLNLPVAPAGDWAAAVEQAVEAVRAFAPGLVLVELSADAHICDPVSELRVSDDDFARAGALLASLVVPVAVELGASTSERAWVGALRGFVSGFDA